MRRYYFELVTANEGGVPVDVDLNASFSTQEVFWNTDVQTDEQLYQQIVFRVCRKPKNIILHLQRIQFAYTQKLTEQLYAALVDLLWVLDGKGKAFSNRMISATHFLLSEAQIDLLSKYKGRQSKSVLLGNKYSVLSIGFVGTNQLLVEKTEKAVVHDPLVLALDYIEYSQLDEAIEVLEEAVEADPSREELQTQLLELYKVTRKGQEFKRMHSKLLGKALVLVDEWQDLIRYFEGMQQ